MRFRSVFVVSLLISNSKITHVDAFDEKRTFGPIFNDSAFLIPALRLQKEIETLEAADGTTLADICNAPLSPQSSVCNIQSIWSYWQDEEENMKKTGFNEQTQHQDTYLDHFVLCSR